MYRIYLDGELFYDPRLPEYALTGIKCDLEVNKTGTLRFTIPATHPLIDSVQKMYSELTLYQDKDWLYSGRVLSDDTDFDGNRTIECEGELSYLLDSIQRYHEYHDISVKDYFTDLIAKHNADVDDRKRFVVVIPMTAFTDTAHMKAHGQPSRIDSSSGWAVISAFGMKTGNGSSTTLRTMKTSTLR